MIYDSTTPSKINFLLKSNWFPFVPLLFFVFCLETKRSEAKQIRYSTTESPQKLTHFSNANIVMQVMRMRINPELLWYATDVGVPSEGPVKCQVVLSSVWQRTLAAFAAAH